MRELARIMPARSWIQTADASTTGDAPTGAPADPAATAATDGAGPTANLVGCVPGQQDTATMMVRLRQLFRVSDVELKESAVESSAGTAGETTIDNCGSFYKFDITVNFSPTPPASEAPRGATRVPASLGGGS